MWMACFSVWYVLDIWLSTGEISGSLIHMFAEAGVSIIDKYAETGRNFKKYTISVYYIFL